MASERVKFTRNFDYTWPNRSVTAYPNNYEGRVKAEVAEAAVAAGAARRTRLVTEPGETPTKGKRKRSSGRGPGRPRKARVEGVQGGKIDQAQPEPTLPGNLPADLAEPQALTPNLHVDDADNSQ